VIAIAIPTFATLYAYYARSRSLEAGVDADTVYTFIGLQWFVALHNPITFAGATYSYHQMPLLLLGHLPGVVLGIDRLGAFAVHCGPMVEVSLLLAAVVERLVPGAWWRRVTTGVLVAAVFSDRLMILGYNSAGYTLPAIALGLMFAVIAGDPHGNPDRAVGGLLAFALLHHYPGWTTVAPLVGAWLVLRRGGLAKVRAFVVANPVLLTVVGVAAITAAVRPALLFARIHDVAATGESVGDLWQRTSEHWRYLWTVLPAVRFQELATGDGGSLLLLNTPPLAGLALPLLVTSWAASIVAVPGYEVRCLALLVSFIGGLSILTAAQHLLTDFLAYRDIPLVEGATVIGLLFNFRALLPTGSPRVVLLTLASTMALYNWVDMGTLPGHRFNYYEYAPRAQEGLEAARRLARSGRFAALGTSRVVIVGEGFVALERPYVAALAHRGVEANLVKLSAYCADADAALQQTMAARCDAFILIVPTAGCSETVPISQETARPGVAARLYRSVCDGADRGPRPTEPVQLDG
jgi:hypothetical protein